MNSLFVVFTLLVAAVQAEFQIKSNWLEEGKAFNPRHTCFSGELFGERGDAPPLYFVDPPEGTQSVFILFCDHYGGDIDYEENCKTIHWTIWNVLPHETEFTRLEALFEDGAIEGANSLTSTKKRGWYFGPCARKSANKLAFHAFALDKLLDYEPLTGKNKILPEIQGNILGYAYLSGIWSGKWMEDFDRIPDEYKPTGQTDFQSVAPTGSDPTPEPTSQPVQPTSRPTKRTKRPTAQPTDRPTTTLQEGKCRPLAGGPAFSKKCRLPFTYQATKSSPKQVFTECATVAEAAPHDSGAYPTETLWCPQKNAKKYKGYKSSKKFRNWQLCECNFS